MLNTKIILYALDDVTILPAASSKINSRSECNPCYGDKLPIFTAPMTSVVSEGNLEVWEKNGITPILPRNIDIEKRLDYAVNGTWAAFSLDEFQEYFIDKVLDLPETKEVKVLIDIANGHMERLRTSIMRSKVLMSEFRKGTDYQIMAGNIANPETYKLLSEAGCDYVRCSVGSGNVCVTSSNVGVHHPMATLLDECYKLKCNHDLKAKIIADGGINSFRRANVALALGADYVMIGSAFAGCYESAAEFHFVSKFCPYSEGSDYIEFVHYATNACVSQHHYHLLKNGQVKIFDKDENNSRVITPPEDMKKDIISQLPFLEDDLGTNIYKEVFGMASRKAQALISKEGGKKTAEGILKKIPVKYTVAQWVDNFKSYLRSCMSYCGKTTLESFVGEVETVIMSPIAKDSFNK